MKRPKPADEDRLQHIADSIEFILQHTGGITEDDFYRNDVLKRAVAMDLVVLGEAANSLSEQVRTDNSDIPWREMINLRHKIVHHYFHINYVVVWEVIKTELPQLKLQLEKLIRKENE